jgi:hypothetical protein
LCVKCNCGLGNFNDNFELMSKAIDYLRRFQMKEVKRKPASYGGQIASAPMAGTGDTPSHKSHDKTIALGNGLAMGSVHSAHTKETTKLPKHNQAVLAPAKAMRERAIAGNSGETGMTPAVSNQKTGHGGPAGNIHNKTVRNKAYGFTKRSEQGGANPSAFAGK